MKKRRLRLTTKHAKASIRLCNVLLFFVLGGLISVASSLFFTFIGSEARSAADDLNILSNKTRQQVLLIDLARTNAEFLADKSFRKDFIRDQSLDLTLYMSPARKCRQRPDPSKIPALLAMFAPAALRERLARSDNSVR